MFRPRSPCAATSLALAALLLACAGGAEKSPPSALPTAESSSAQALETFEATIRELDAQGIENERLALALFEAGTRYAAQHRFSEAERTLERALPLIERTLGPENEFAGITLHQLALIRGQQERFDESYALFERSVHVLRVSTDPQHSKVGHGLYYLAWIDASKGKLVPARQRLDEAESILEENARRGSDDPILTQTRVLQTRVLAEQGRGEEAAAKLDLALPRLAGALEPGQRTDLAHYLAHRAEAEYRMARWGQARQYYERALAVARTLGAEGEWTRRDIAGSYHAMLNVTGPAERLRALEREFPPFDFEPPPHPRNLDVVVADDLVVRGAAFGLIEVDEGGAWRLVETNVLPNRRGAKAGWVLWLDTTRPSVAWEEHWDSPGGPGWDGDLHPDALYGFSEDGKTMVYDEVGAPVEGRIYHAWELTHETPLGRWRIQVFLDRKHVTDFEFEVR